MSLITNRLQPTKRGAWLALAALAAAAAMAVQDPPATLLLPGRTRHPQSTPSHPALPPGLALAKAVQLCPGETASPCPSLPDAVLGV